MPVHPEAPAGGVRGAVELTGKAALPVGKADSGVGRTQMNKLAPLL